MLGNDARYTAPSLSTMTEAAIRIRSKTIDAVLQQLYSILVWAVGGSKTYGSTNPLTRLGRGRKLALTASSIKVLTAATSSSHGR